MRLLLLLCSLSLTACLQTENSNSLDADLIGNEAHVNILLNNCGGCHNEVLHSAEDLAAVGWIVPGDPESSKLYYRMADSEGPNGPKDMPPGGTLVLSDIDLIRDWIESL